jgi:DNA-binding PadR family transcriptional regulator
MSTENLTPVELAVVNLIKEQPLTSFQILKKVESISMIIVLYTVIDDLKNKGIVKSYIEQNVKYHCVA